MAEGRSLVRLNGWQRIWTVVAIGYGLIVAVGVASMWPSKEDIYSEWFDDVVRAYGERLSGSTPSEIRASYPDMTDQQIVEAAVAKARSRNLEAMPAVGETITFTLLDLVDAELDSSGKRFEARLAALPRERRRAVWFGFLVWSVPMVAVYGFGWSVGWIRRGFRAAA